MKILFIGGTGNISRACVKRAFQEKLEVSLFNRGSHSELVPAGATVIKGDIRDTSQAGRILEGQHFDVVADFISYKPEHIESAIKLFSGKVYQYIFISSASVYHKPPLGHIIAESTPLHNPYWQYARDKIACETLLQKEYSETAFPFTIVRPSHTYNDGWLPSTFGSRDFTIAQRMLDGKEIVVHGDGQSIWTLTHAEDFAVALLGLMGHPQARGDAFNITSDEVLSWDRIHQVIADGLGVKAKIVHMPSDVIAKVYPEIGAGLLGDKAYSTIFDSSKIKRLVPYFQAKIPYHLGIRRSLAWYESHPENKAPNADLDRSIDSLLAKWNPLVNVI